MNEILQKLVRDSETGIAGTIFGLALLLLTAVAMPRDQRRRLRTPLLMFLAHLAAEALALLVPVQWGMRKPISVAALFFLWLQVGQLLPMLVLDGVLQARLAWTMPKIFRDIVQLLAYFAIGLVVLHAAGVEPGSLLTTSALLTAVIGLSLQDTLGNLFAGLAIQVQRPFEIGDFVQLGDSVEPLGRVMEINWRATKVLTNDRFEIIVPNANLARAAIRNFSKPTRVLRRSIQVQAPYEFAPAHIIGLLENALDGTPLVLAEPRPMAIVRNFEADGVLYELRYFTEEAEFVHVTDGKVRERIWHSFRRAGVAIPYTQRDVHVYSMQGESPEQLRAAKQAKRRATLRGVDLFEALPDDSLELLVGLVHTRRYAAGEYVLRKGDAGAELFIVEHGEVAVVVEQAQGPAQELARLGPGKFFGEMSLLTGASRTATVRAVADLALLVVDKQAFQQVLQQSPQLAERISSLLASRQQQLDRHTARTTDSFQRQELKSTDMLAKIKEFFAL
jgi:small-conductance mechanosensitive channel/CRP-like cAMP-binding protein